MQVIENFYDRWSDVLEVLIILWMLHGFWYWLGCCSCGCCRVWFLCYNFNVGAVVVFVCRVTRREWYLVALLKFIRVGQRFIECANLPHLRHFMWSRHWERLYPFPEYLKQSLLLTAVANSDGTWRLVLWALGYEVNLGDFLFLFTFCQLPASSMALIVAGWCSWVDGAPRTEGCGGWILLSP
jgi:hypothetical protein